MKQDGQLNRGSQKIQYVFFVLVAKQDKCLYILLRAVKAIFFLLFLAAEDHTKWNLP
jgi:hypothetical protein